MDVPVGLIRKDALIHAVQREHGTLLPLPKQHRWALYLTLVAITALIAWLFTGNYTRRVTVQGVLGPATGTTHIQAPRTARVSNIHVQGGTAVKAGDPLFNLKDDQEGARTPDGFLAQNAQLEADRQRLGVELDQAAEIQVEQHRALDKELATARVRQRKIGEQQKIQHQQVEIKRDIVERMKPLVSKGYVSSLQYKERESELLRALSEEQALVAQYAEAEQTIASLHSRIRQLPAETSSRVSQIRDRLSAVEQALIRNDTDESMVVRSPVNGVVANIFVSEGSHVSAAESMATLVPHSTELVANIYVGSEAIGFVREGTVVALRYTAFPYQKFGIQGGRVTVVPSTTMTLRDDPRHGTGGSQDMKPFYRVQVDLPRQDIDVYGQAVPLKAGMAVTTDLLLERRSLIEWMFEPLIGLGKRMDRHRETP